MKPRVLVIQDDDGLRTQVCGYLSRAQMQATGISSARELQRRIGPGRHDVIVCDVDHLLEGRFEAVARLRSAARAGVIVLTGRRRHEDRIHALSLGVDHYIETPPLQLDVLELHIRNLCRRTTAFPAVDGHAADIFAASPVPAQRGWLFHATAWTLTAPTGRSLHLTLAEYHILRRLMGKPGKVAERNDILAALGGEYVEVYSRNLDMMISRLRRKVKKNCGATLPVHSARGVGYVFTGPGEVVGGE